MRYESPCRRPYRGGRPTTRVAHPAVRSPPVTGPTVSTRPPGPYQAGGMATDPSDRTRIEGTVLDHVAHAVPRWTDVWDRYATDLGAVWASGGPGPGFAPGQLRFANGARVEVLMPYAVEVNDFLARFLARNGPGPHHLTFKVPDLGRRPRAGAPGRLRAGRHRPVRPRVEGGLPPPQGGHRRGGAAGRGPARLEQPAPGRLSHGPPPAGRRFGPHCAGHPRTGCHVVADLAGARHLFAGLLAGEVVGEGSADGIRWVDLRWLGPLGLRLVAADDPTAPGPVSEWLGDRSGRVHHLAVETEEPDAVPGARPGHRSASTVRRATARPPGGAGRSTPPTTSGSPWC